jgi:hypothetical protein
MLKNHVLSFKDLKQQDLMVAIRQTLSETQPDPVSLEPEIADSGVMA